MINPKTPKHQVTKSVPATAQHSSRQHQTVTDPPPLSFLLERRTFAKRTNKTWRRTTPLQDSTPRWITWNVPVPPLWTPLLGSL